MSFYYRDKRKAWRFLIRQRAVESLGGKCSNCGVVFSNPTMYDFHHINFNKDFTIGQMNMTSPKKWLLIRDELRKCCLLCPNCHRGYHCGEIEISFKDSYFNEDYYEWEVVNYTNCQIDEDLNIINRYEKKKDKTAVCPRCGGPKSWNGQICRFCKIKETRTVPEREELLCLIKTDTVKSISSIYEVSETTIRRWLEFRGLPSHKKEIDIFFGRTESKQEKEKIVYKEVEQYSKNGEYIATYKNCSIAGKAIGKIENNKHINECCNGKRKTAYGYVWKFKE